MSVVPPTSDQYAVDWSGLVVVAYASIAFAALLVVVWLVLHVTNRDSDLDQDEN